MPNLIPITIIALGSFLLLTQREVRLVLGAFFLQWVGMAWLVWVSASAGAGRFTALVELVAALSTSTVMAITLFRRASSDDQAYPASSVVRRRAGRRALRLPRSQAAQPQDWILLWGLGVLAGVAGYGLARINPLGVNEGEMLTFFWMALAAVLTLTFDGARSAVKQGLSIMALLNSALLLLYIVGNSTPPVGVLALAALVRIGAGMIASYLWLNIGERYGTLNLNALFDSREGIVPQSTSLALVALNDQNIDGDSALTSDEQAPEEGTLDD